MGDPSASVQHYWWCCCFLIGFSMDCSVTGCVIENNDDGVAAGRWWRRWWCRESHEKVSESNKTKLSWCWAKFTGSLVIKQSLGGMEGVRRMFTSYLRPKLCLLLNNKKEGQFSDSWYDVVAFFQTCLAFLSVSASISW